MEQIRFSGLFQIAGRIFIADANTPAVLGALLPLIHLGAVNNPAGVPLEKTNLPEVGEVPDKWSWLTEWRPAELHNSAVASSRLPNAAGQVIAPDVAKRSTERAR